MEENKKVYQLVLILDEESSDVVNEIGKKIENEGAKLLETDPLGSRPFAYPSKKESSGYYVRYLFESSSDFIEKFRQILKPNNRVRLQYYLTI